MSRTKNNPLQIPLISSSYQKPKVITDLKATKELYRKKAMLKAYQNDASPLLPRRNFKKIQGNDVTPISNLSMPRNNHRYERKPQLNQYLEEGRLVHNQQYINNNMGVYRRKQHLRPESLLKIPQKTSVMEIRSRRQKQSNRNQQSREIQLNHSMDLFKIKQSKIRDSSKKKIVASILSPTKAQILLDTGKKLYKQGRFEQSQKCFVQSSNEDPELLQNYYFLAIINLNRKQFQKSVNELKKIIKRKSDYKKSVYLFLCISLKNISKNQQAILIASQGLKLYPDYFDLLLYRAKLYQLDNILDLAEKDYDSAIALKDDSAEAYLKKGQCLFLLKQYKKAINILTTALYLDQGYKNRVLQQRIRCYLQSNQINDAKKDMEKLINLDAHSSQTFELKGFIQVKQGLIDDAILSFQQCIKNNTSKKSISVSLVEITKFKIKDRDFYSAYHHICRSQFLQICTPVVQMYKLFTEGVIFLMKRKINQGLKNLNKLAQKYGQMDEYLIKLFHLYRAFGYFVSNQHEKCLEDYYIAQKYQKKQRHSIFNMLLAEGIVQTKNKNYKKAFQKYNEAQQMMPQKIQPLLYKAVNYTLMACDYYSQDQINKLQTVFLALKELDKAHDINSSNSNMLFLRCLIYYYLGKIRQGLQDIARAISKSQQNVPKYFFYRGLANGTLKNYKQAQNDFTICINLDQKFEQAYFQRAKTYFLQHQIFKANQDLKKYVQFRPKQNINLLQGNLFFGSGQYEQALKRYDNGIDTKQILKMKVRCYLATSQYKKALTYLKKLDKIQPDEYSVDLCIIKIIIILTSQQVDIAKLEELSGILSTSTIHKNKIFSQYHVYHYLGVCYYYMKKYGDSLAQFNKAYKQRQILNIQMEMEQRDLKNGKSISEIQQDEQVQEIYQRDFNQINYNIFLCFLNLGEIKKAHQLFIRNIFRAKQNMFQNEDLSQLSHLIFKNLKKSEEQQQINQKSNQKILEATFFNNSISIYLPHLTINLKYGTLKTKLCLLLPSTRMPDMYPSINSKYIISKIKLIQVQNKPQPPWVKRNTDQNLIFTDDIQQMENIEFNTQQNEQQTEQQEQQEQEQQQQYEQNNQNYQQSQGSYQGIEGNFNNNKMDVQKIKRAMKLDDSIEQKLNKLLKKAKNKEDQKKVET